MKGALWVTTRQEPLTIVSLVLTKIAVTIYAGDVVVRTLLGIDTADILGLQIDVFWVIARGLAFTTGVIGGFARLAADLVLRSDSVAATTLKEQLFRHAITANQFNASVAPMAK